MQLLGLSHNLRKSQYQVGNIYYDNILSKFFLLQHISVELPTVIQGRRNLLGRQGSCPTTFCEIYYSLPYQFLRVNIQYVKTAQPVFSASDSSVVISIILLINFQNRTIELTLFLQFQGLRRSSIIGAVNVSIF